MNSIKKTLLLKTKKIDVDTHATRKPSENVVIYEKKTTTRFKIRKNA